MMQRLEIIIDEENDSAEIEIEMTPKNLTIAVGRMLDVLSKELDIDQEPLAIALARANKETENKDA